MNPHLIVYARDALHLVGVLQVCAEDPSLQLHLFSQRGSEALAVRKGGRVVLGAAVPPGVEPRHQRSFGGVEGSGVLLDQGLHACRHGV